MEVQNHFQMEEVEFILHGEKHTGTPHKSSLLMSHFSLAYSYCSYVHSHCKTFSKLARSLLSSSLKFHFYCVVTNFRTKKFGIITYSPNISCLFYWLKLLRNQKISKKIVIQITRSFTFCWPQLQLNNCPQIENKSLRYTEILFMYIQGFPIQSTKCLEGTSWADLYSMKFWVLSGEGLDFFKIQQNSFFPQKTLAY